MAALQNLRALGLRFQHKGRVIRSEGLSIMSAAPEHVAARQPCLLKIRLDRQCCIVSRRGLPATTKREKSIALVVVAFSQRLA